MDKSLTYLLISDIHLGHSINKTDNIVLNLDRFFKKYMSDILKCDIIFISGDVFDKLLSNNSLESNLAYAWLSRLALFCRNNNIKLRILEGTPSHDWKQVKLLDSILESLEIDNLDYKYYDILDIEYIEDYNMYIMYLPDEWKNNADEIYKDVKKKLKEYKLEKVDIIIMHGAFKYQIPNVESDQFHNEEDYINITNYTVNCGHVHNRSQYDKILVPGSFDRLTFADEGIEKGGLLVHINNDGFTYKFLKNIYALEFKTIDITDMDLEILEKRLDKLNKQHKVIHVRLLNKRSDNSIIFNLQELKHKYSNLRFTVTNKIDDKVSVVELKKEIKEYNIVLNKNTIKDMITEDVNKLALTHEEREMLLEELDNILI